MLTFQGHVTNPDGSPYHNKIITTALKLYTVSVNGNELEVLSNNDRLQQFYVQRGSYTITINVNEALQQKLIDNSDVYLEIYLATGNVIDYNSITKPDINNSYKLTPRIHLLAAPRVFQARGVRFNSTGRFLAVGGAYKNVTSDTIENGMIVNGSVGIGVKDPGGVALKVSANAKNTNVNALYVSGDLIINGSGNQLNATGGVYGGVWN
ncbi:hypothetical protein NO2_1434 [Candidatus Termititenax persephonae]|uniref:Uncharacterized protein n=1 Tax=Candidatus Termititenax persephonae TaxID=2218525 RepID=A0A388TID4_9BACT|nr:hypothetical protein NO2_1434 [Candidatus Termititenax persephonae]